MAKKRSTRSVRRTTRPRAVAAKKKTPARGARTAARKTAAPKKATRKKAARSATRRPSEIFAPVKGAERREFGHVLLEVGKAGAARVKRMIYPAGFRWSKDMKPVVGTELCMHAHVGFLVHGEIHIEYPDGCVIEHRAPQIVVIEPGHDGWVVGKEPVVMVEFDFEGDTVAKLGMPSSHTHAPAVGPRSVPS
ncbi:MAG TPA: hypothetical protein VGQ37_25330 [Vicinamibacterales bacterium]|jgi:hypothetical protein|nr:hypothetical protein [Vicinamibacterales bacterium]